MSPSPLMITSNTIVVVSGLLKASVKVAADRIVVDSSIHLSGLGLSVLSRTVYQRYFSSFSVNVIDPVY